MSRTARVLRALADAIRPEETSGMEVRADAPTEEASGMEVRADAPTFSIDTGMGDYRVDKGARRAFQVRQPLTYGEIDAAYAQGGLWRRVIELIPAEGTRRGWRCDLGEERAVCSEVDRDLRMDVRSNFRDAWTYARKDGYAVLMMLTDDAEDLSAPLPPDAAVLGLQLYDYREARPVSYNTDPESPSFRDPLVWSITPASRGGTASAAQRALLTVHATRLIVFYGPRLPPSMVWWTQVNATSILELYVDALFRNDSIESSTAIAAQEMNFKVRTIGNLGTKAGQNGADVIRAAARDFGRQLSALGFGVIPDGDKIEVHTLGLTGLREVAIITAESIASVEGYPITVLKGQAPGGMTTDNEAGKRTMDRLVSARQIDDIEPQLRQLYSQVLRSRGEDPAGLRIHFASLDEPDLSVMAEVRLKRTQSDVALVQAGILDPTDIVRTRFTDPDDPDEIRIEEADVSEYLTGPGGESVEGAVVAPKTGNVASTGLNGSQIQQLVEMTKSVRSGVIDADTARIAAGIAFPAVDAETLDRLFASIRVVGPVSAPTE